MHLEQLKGLLDQVSQVVRFPLAVINFVTQVVVTSFKQVHNWQNLSVIGDKCFADGIGAGDKTLQNLKGNCNNLRVSGVESGLDGNDQLRNDRKDFGTSLLKHVENSLNC